MERKVSYVLLAGNKVGEVEPLIDSGLSSPHGLTYDKKRSILYIADMGAEKIYSYRLNVKACGQWETCQSPYMLEVEGVQNLLVQDVKAAWLTLDSTGSLFFTDQETKSVNRLDRSVLLRLQAKELEASELVRNTQQALEAMERSAASADLQGEAKSRAANLLKKAKETSIESLYEADGDKHISLPSGILTDDVEVFWANQADGVAKGTVVSGLADMHLPVESVVVANRSNTAYGLAGTDGLLLFTDEKRYLYGMKKIGGDIICLTDSLHTPRAIAWDGGQTAYVADAGGNSVYSLPVGFLAANQPLEHLLDIHNPFGLALIQSCDAAFLPHRPAGMSCEDESGAQAFGRARRLAGGLQSGSTLVAFFLLASSLAPLA
jgi:sugar lactone lactonase YvrE